MRIAVRCLVSGRVQGVWYRASTQRVAVALGLEGYAKNLPNGRVEVVACGEEHAVRQLQHWLHDGPPLAEVERVDCTPIAPPEVSGFSTR